MSIKAELVYDRGLVLRGINSHWRNVVGFRFLVALGLVVASTSVLLCIGNRSWFVGVLGAAPLLCVSFLFTLYLSHRHSALARLHAMGRPTVNFSADESGFTLQSSLGASTLPWSSIKSISRFPDYWLVYFARSQFITLPIANLPTSTTEFVAAQVATAGGDNGA
jgi:hypothetical protein